MPFFSYLGFTLSTLFFPPPHPPLFSFLTSTLPYPAVFPDRPLFFFCIPCPFFPQISPPGYSFSLPGFYPHPSHCNSCLSPLKKNPVCFFFFFPFACLPCLRTLLLAWMCPRLRFPVRNFNGLLFSSPQSLIPSLVPSPSFPSAHCLCFFHRNYPPLPCGFPVH